jgi:hypothetical protein
LFCRKNRQVALEDVSNICPQQILPPSPYRLDECLYQGKVTTVAHTFRMRPMYGRLTSAEIRHCELIHITELVHITHDLPKCKMQARLSLTYKRRVSNHRESASCP